MAMNTDSSPSNPPASVPARLSKTMKRSLLGTLLVAAAAAVWIVVDVRAQQKDMADPAPMEGSSPVLPSNDAGAPEADANEAPATAPSDAEADVDNESPRRPRPILPGLRERVLGEFRGGDYRRDLENLPIAQEPPTEEEWKEVLNFAEEHMPNRIRFYRDLVAARGENAPVVRNIRHRLTMRYRVLQRTRAENWRFYDRALDQLRLEDEVWGEVRSLKADPQNETLRASVRAKVYALTQSLLDERGYRIARVKEIIENEEAALAEARENIDSMVNDQMQTLLNEQPGNGDEVPAPEENRRMRRRFDRQRGGDAGERD